MGNTNNTRQRIANGQAVKHREAVRMLKSLADDWAPKRGKGSHILFFIGRDKLQLSEPGGDQLKPYQIKQIQTWLTKHGR